MGRNKSIGLKAGIDFNYFGFGSTHVPYNMSPAFNLGMNIAF